MMGDKEFDLVIFGATSFVGKILCEYLVGEYPESDFRWAMAARSKLKLISLRNKLGGDAVNIPLIVADSFNESELKALCERTSVVISTVGPYALYGDLLIKVCAELGTDYCDLTGEVQWVRRMIAEYGETAKVSGARIINCCGFDSIPSDLGVKFLQQHALSNFGSYCEKVLMRVKASKGRPSGGTIASALNIYSEAAKNSDLRKELRDYYSLCPEGHGNKVKQRSISFEYDEFFKAWLAPFIMAATNMRIVLRSNAIAKRPYTEQFEYNEAVLTAEGKEGQRRAKRLARLSKFSSILLAVAPIRGIVALFLPKPGEGPSPEEQQAGYFDFRFVGRTNAGDEALVKVTGDRDPGYGSSAKMLAQAGLSLRYDVDKTEIPGGFWTPATAFGDKLIDRLQLHAGLIFELKSISKVRTDSYAEDTGRE